MLKYRTLVWGNIPLVFSFMPGIFFTSSCHCRSTQVSCGFAVVQANLLWRSQKPLDIQNNTGNLCSDKCFNKICGVHYVEMTQPWENTCGAEALHYPGQRLIFTLAKRGMNILFAFMLALGLVTTKTRNQQYHNKKQFIYFITWKISNYNCVVHNKGVRVARYVLFPNSPNHILWNFDLL